MEIVWDEPKRITNLKIHGLDFAEVEDGFEFAEALIAPSYESEHGGSRFIAVGMLDGDLVSLVFAPLGTEAISLISLRPASKRERKAYAHR